MSFYDINPISLPKQATYYHNVLMICIGVTPELWPVQNVTDIWYLDQITSARPTAYLFYLEPKLEQEEDEDGELMDFDISIINHCVVEICENSVCWYSTEDENDDFDLKDAWKI